MPVSIDTPLLIVGSGPAALVVAKVASGYGLASVVAGHESGGRAGGEATSPADAPVALDADAVSVLTPHGVLDVLRPYLSSAQPPAIAPSLFEEVLKHHCVADMNVTVYDGMRLVEREARGGGGIEGVVGVLSDGRSRWPVRADAFVDADTLPNGLPEAITAGAERAKQIVASLTS
jgi:hypothetical protein